MNPEVSGAGDAWSDSRIVEAVETSAVAFDRVRRQLVDAGVEGVLRRKQCATPAVPPILDCENDAKLVALACSITIRTARARTSGENLAPVP